MRGECWEEDHRVAKAGRGEEPRQSEEPRRARADAARTW